MRCVIFGVDGLSWRILQPLIERGDLPNFARLQREGVVADFISSVPSVTPPAWMSLVTGLKPAKHGVFDFWEFDTALSGLNSRVVTRRKGGKAIWNILSEYGKRVIVLNVPATYPPDSVNGVMISGLLTPGASSPFTFPSHLKQEIYRAVPDYWIDLQPKYRPQGTGSQRMAHPAVADVLAMTEQRMRLQEHLLSEREWDFAFLCYVGPDRLQHRLWDELMTFSHEATRYFRLLDDALGRVLSRLSAEDMLFVVSDHGFVGAKQWFYINEYLRRRGLLSRGSALSQNQAQVIGLGREVAQKLRLLGFAREARVTYQKLRGDTQEKLPVQQRRGPLQQPFFKDMDWSHTRACVLSGTAFSGGIADIVMSPGTSLAGMEELRLALEAERHPETGEPLARAVYATDILGIGPFRPPVEHIMLIPRSGVTFHLGIGRRNLWERLDETRGIHEAEGVFFAWGAGIRQGVRVEPLQIYDLVPTLLHGLDIRADEPFDGRVAREIFETASESENAGSLVMRKLRRLQGRAMASIAQEASG